MMIRWLYAGLLRLHPPGFRQRFGQEMLWIFDQAKANGRTAPLFADAMPVTVAAVDAAFGILAPTRYGQPQSFGWRARFLHRRG